MGDGYGGGWLLGGTLNPWLRSTAPRSCTSSAGGRTIVERIGSIADEAEKCVCLLALVALQLARPERGVRV
jgi:hypothetical protein